MTPCYLPVICLVAGEIVVLVEKVSRVSISWKRRIEDEADARGIDS